MSPFLLDRLAARLGRSPDDVEASLRQLAAAVRERVERTGRASVPTFGRFRREDGTIVFYPVEVLAEAVNQRFAGLDTVSMDAPVREAEPRHAEPAAPSRAPAAASPDAMAPLPRPPRRPPAHSPLAPTDEGKVPPEPPPPPTPPVEQPAPADAPPPPDKPAPTPPEALGEEEDAYWEQHDENEPHPLGPLPTKPYEEADYAVVGAGAQAAKPPDPTAAAAAAHRRDLRSRRQRERQGIPPVAIAAVILLVIVVSGSLFVFFRTPSTVTDPPPVTAEGPAADTSRADTSATGSASPTPSAAEPTTAAPPADPLRGTAPIAGPAGGFTLVVGSETSRSRAESRAKRFRDDGYRANVLYGPYRGVTRYRIGLGQYKTLSEAQAGRRNLPASAPSDAWPMPVDTDFEIF